MDISSLKAASEYDDDGIYVLSEDEMDSQTVLDLQLELSIIKKRLRSTELAYRALEDEYVSLKSSNSVSVACLADLEFSAKQYPNTLQGGTAAAEDCMRLLRQHVDETSDDQSGSTRILMIWTPPTIYSRDFKAGFSACKDALLIETGGQEKVQSLLSSLLPLPQVKKVYTTLAPGKTTQLLLPHIKQALDSAHEVCTNGNNANNNSTSPFMRHRRSFTSASSLSTMSRSSGNGDSLLSKFILLQTASSDKKSQEAIKELKEEICKTYADNEAISKDLAETDFASLFPRLDCPDLWTAQPVEKETTHPVEKEVVQVVQTEVAQPVQKETSQALKEEAVQPPVEKENMWAEIVRKGRSKEPVKAAPSSASVAIPSTPAAHLPNAKIPPSPSSPTMSTSPSAASRNDASVSPNRTRRSRGGVKKEKPVPASNTEGPTESVRLDPTVSLCRQKKPPCNQYYLTVTGCTNPKCNYSHSYKLTVKQLDEMRSGAAKTACVYRKTGQPCASGDECVFGHKCPQGSRCKQNKCHFPSHMH
ncbi:hypothetical protein P389DRAFT_82058 [Cystobasidium minutum MCA 4210]|uniref:uncharacterized protein n=1 Tax=Cystobasidium minutum MCA 4210 TaxID=1397322 RepID=UPI0034CE6753|eukprot:jgi/Rhomi1/82058/CE82057_608